MKPAVAVYETRVYIHCPHDKCDGCVEFSILGDFDITNIPQVGEIFTCTRCGQRYVIDAERSH